MIKKLLISPVRIFFVVLDFQSLLNILHFGRKHSHCHIGQFLIPQLPGFLYISPWTERGIVFINCNIVGREAQDPSARIYREMKAAGATPDMMEMISILGANYASEKKRIQCFEDVLETSVLPNTIATSILVYDEAGNYLLSRRTDNVIIGKKFYGVTASGSVDPADLAKIPQKGNPGIDPFCSCAARELAEETTLGIPDRNFKFRGLVIGKEKLQPIAIVDALSPNLFDDEWRIFDPSDGDPDAEVAKIVSVPQSKLVRMPEKYEMTEAASYHMRIHAENT